MGQTDPSPVDKNGKTAIVLAIKGATETMADPYRIETHVEVMDRLEVIGRYMN